MAQMIRFPLFLLVLLRDISATPQQEHVWEIQPDAWYERMMVPVDERAEAIQLAMLSGSCSHPPAPVDIDVPVLVLNLRERKDRRLHTRCLLRSLGFSNIRFLDAMAADDVERERPEEVRHFFDSDGKVGHVRGCGKFSRGCLACIVSHRRALSIGMASGWERFLVVEDDLMIGMSLTRARKSVQDAIRDLPSSADLLYLEACFENCRNLLYSNLSSIARAHQPLCTGAILYSRAGADKVLRDSNSAFASMDTMLKQLIDEEGTLEGYIATPPVLYQDFYFGSDLGSNYQRVFNRAIVNTTHRPDAAVCSDLFGYTEMSVVQWHPSSEALDGLLLRRSLSMEDQACFFNPQSLLSSSSSSSFTYLILSDPLVPTTSRLGPCRRLMYYTQQRGVEEKDYSKLVGVWPSGLLGHHAVLLVLDGEGACSDLSSTHFCSLQVELYDDKEEIVEVHHVDVLPTMFAPATRRHGSCFLLLSREPLDISFLARADRPLAAVQLTTHQRSEDPNVLFLPGRTRRQCWAELVEKMVQTFILPLVTFSYLVFVDLGSVQDELPRELLEWYEKVLVHDLPDLPDLVLASSAPAGTIGKSFTSTSGLVAVSERFMALLLDTFENPSSSPWGIQIAVDVAQSEERPDSCEQARMGSMTRSDLAVFFSSFFNSQPVNFSLERADPSSGSVNLLLLTGCARISSSTSSAPPAPAPALAPAPSPPPALPAPPAHPAPALSHDNSSFPSSNSPRRRAELGDKRDFFFLSDPLDLDNAQLPSSSRIAVFLMGQVKPLVTDLVTLPSFSRNVLEACGPAMVDVFVHSEPPAPAPAPALTPADVRELFRLWIPRTSLKALVVLPAGSLPPMLEEELTEEEWVRVDWNMEEVVTARSKFVAQYARMRELYPLLLAQERYNRARYSHVVRMRTDVAFARPWPPLTPPPFPRALVLGPRFSSPGLLLDHFFIVSRAASWTLLYEMPLLFLRPIHLRSFVEGPGCLEGEEEEEREEGEEGDCKKIVEGRWVPSPEQLVSMFLRRRFGKSLACSCNVTGEFVVNSQGSPALRPCRKWRGRRSREEEYAVAELEKYFEQDMYL